MKLLNCIIFLLVLNISSKSQNNLHLQYEFIAIAEKEADKQKMQAMVAGFSKEYYRSGEKELMRLTMGEGEEFKYYADGTSDKIELFAVLGDKKMLVEIDKAYFEKLNARSQKGNPVVFSNTESTKKIHEVECMLSQIEMMGRKLEFWLDKTSPTKLPVSSYLMMNGENYLPIIMETLIPQREGVESKDKIRIKANRISNDIDASVFDIDKDSYKVTSIREAQEALGISFMLLFIF
jgi:hypothetical protein